MVDRHDVQTALAPGVTQNEDEFFFPIISAFNSMSSCGASNCTFLLDGLISKISFFSREMQVDFYAFVASDAKSLAISQASGSFCISSYQFSCARFTPPKNRDFLSDGPSSLRLFRLFSALTCRVLLGDKIEDSHSGGGIGKGTKNETPPLPPPSPAESCEFARIDGKGLRQVRLGQELQASTAAQATEASWIQQLSQKAATRQVGGIQHVE